MKHEFFRVRGLVLGCFLGLLVVGSTLGADGPTITSISASADFETETVSVYAWLDSLFEVASVRATVGTTQVILNSTYPGIWTNSFSFSAFARGTNEIVIDAMDVFGNQTRAVQKFRVDRPPVLRMSSPVEEFVVRNAFLDLDVVAEDDYDRVRLEASVFDGNSTLITRLPVTTNQLRARVELSGPAPYQIVVFGYDSGKNRTTLARSIYGGVNWDYLRPVVSGEGRILDFVGDRVLYSKQRQPNDPSRRSFVIGNRRGEVVSQVDFPKLSGRVWTEHPAFLADWGILLPETDNGYELKAGKISDLAIQPTWPMQVRDGLAFWYARGGYSVLYSLLSPGFLVGNDNKVPLALSANRDLLLGSLSPPTGQLDLYLSRPVDPQQPLVNRQLALVVSLQASEIAGYVNGAGGAPFSFSLAENLARPATDGTNVAFYKNMELRLFTPGGEFLLVGRGDQPVSTIRPVVQVEAGWVAFSKRNPVSGSQQVWTRSPQGVLQQRTFFTAPSLLEKLLPNGWLTYISGSGPYLDRYLSIPGGLPIRLSGEQGRVAMLDGVLYVAYHNTLFQFAPDQLTISTTNGSRRELRVQGLNGSSYHLQSSSNLVNWVQVTDLSAGSTYQLPLADSPYRFFRAIKIP